MLPFVYNGTTYQNSTSADFSQTLTWESSVLAVCYTVLAVVCWFFFYHHPSHNGIQIRKKQDNSNNYAFNIDNTSSGWNRANTVSDEDQN